MSTTMVQQSEGKGAARPQPLKSQSSPGLLRRFTTKLKPPALRTKSASPPTSTNQPSRRCAVPAAPQDLAAIKRRQAALQQCGLAPLLRKDLSQLEEELDQKFSHVVILPQDQPEQGELSSAEKIRREWQGKNETQAEKQSGANDVTSDSLCPGRLVESDLTSDVEEQKALELTVSPSSHTLLAPTSSVPLYSIPGSFLFPDIPEEDVAPVEIEKTLPPIPPAEIVDPLSIPLPDSPLSSSANLPELPLTPSPRESKRPPPIVINLRTIDPKENAEQVTRGRSPNRHNVHSLATKSSLPALSPTMTASSFSSIPTPRDDESRERMEAMVSLSSSGKSRSSRFGKASDTGRDSEDLDVVHETIPEIPEPTATESTAAMGSAGFEAFVEKREKKRRMSTRIFQSNRRNSASSSSRSIGSELSFGWSIIPNDFSLKPFDGRRSRSSTLLSSPTSTDGNKGPTPIQSQTPIEQPRSKIARSKLVIASLGLKVSRKMAPRSAMPTLPPPPPSPTRLSTVRIVQNRESLIQGVEGIEDDESRRLTRAAFMDF